MLSSILANLFTQRCCVNMFCKILCRGRKGFAGLHHPAVQGFSLCGFRCTFLFVYVLSAKPYSSVVHCMAPQALPQLFGSGIVLPFSSQPLPAMARSSRQLTLHDFCFRYNDASRSRSPCKGQHACCPATPAEHWSIESSIDSGMEEAPQVDITLAQRNHWFSYFFEHGMLHGFTYNLWQCMDVNDRIAYQAISFWARSESRWHARDLKMWDTASHANEEHAESESLTSHSALPDSEEDTVYATLPRTAGRRPVKSQWFAVSPYRFLDRSAPHGLQHPGWLASQFWPLTHCPHGRFLLLLAPQCYRSRRLSWLDLEKLEEARMAGFAKTSSSLRRHGIAFMSTFNFCGPQAHIWHGLGYASPCSALENAFHSQVIALHQIRMTSRPQCSVAYSC